MTLSSKVTVLAMALAMSAAAETNAWELGGPDAKLLLGIDLKSLRESALGQSVREQMNAQPTPPPSQAGAQAQQLIAPMQAMAMGLLDQIDRIYLSSPANPTAGAKNNPPFLLAVEGRIPTAEMKPFLKGTMRRYRTVDVYRTSTTDTTSVALVEGGTLLLGDERSVLAAIDRRGRALPPASPLLARALAMASTHDVWMIAEESLAKFQPASSGASNPLASQIASQIKGLEMGMSAHEGFELELNLATESEAAAVQMAQMLGTQIQLAVMAQGNRPETAAMVRKLHIDAEGKQLRMSMAVSKEEFDQQLKALQAARATAVASAQQPEPRPVKPATHPGTITIYGLDGGPRTIQTTH